MVKQPETILAMQIVYATMGFVMFVQKKKVIEYLSRKTRSVI